MIALANFLSGIAHVLGAIFQIYLLLLFVYVILSWFNISPYHPIVRAINASVEPVLYWLRSKFKLIYGGIDFSPIVIFCAIFFLQAFLVQSLHDYAREIKIKNTSPVVLSE